MARKWPSTSVRMNPEALHKARIAAVTEKRTLADWLEQAINEKLERDKEAGRVVTERR